MQLVLFLTKKNSNKACYYFHKYILEFIKENINVTLICESENDFKYMLEISKNEFKVLYIFSKISLSLSDQSNKIKNNKIIFKIDKSIKIYENIIDIDKYLNSFFESVYKKHAITYASLNFADGVFHSYPAVFFNNFCKKNKIIFLFPFPSPANGRFIIYDSIFLNSDKFNHEYKKYFLNKKKINIEYVLSYIEKYKLYEKDFRYRKKRFKRNINFIQSLKTNIKLIYRRNFTQYKKIKYKKNNQSYILYMLTKTDSHWFTNYANPELTNRIDNIKSIHEALPNNFNLVLKFHPRISIDYEIESYAVKYDNIKLSYDRYNQNLSYDLIKNAELIIGYGTTSIMHPLYQYKKVIDVGANSTYYNFVNPPVKRVRSFKMITKEFMKKCLNDEIDINKIHAYFNALLITSYLFYKDSNEILDLKPIDQKIIIADKLINIIKKDKSFNSIK